MQWLNKWSMINGGRAPLRALKAFSLLVLAASPALACGPFFPNSLLEAPHETLLSAPSMRFHDEVKRLNIPAPDGLKTVDPPEGLNVYTHSVETDITVLERALRQDPKRPAAERENLTKEYRRVRETVAQWKQQYERWEWDSAWNDVPPPVFDKESLVTPTGLPKEFAHYLDGFIALQKGQTNDACVAWCRVLDLPEKERQHRSVWAAFMLGKAMLGVDRAAAIRWFRKTRQLKWDGFSDELGLAASSLGWEALAELREKNYERAIELYLQHDASGDRTAVRSLEIAADFALGADAETLVKLARNVTVQHVLTARLASYGGGNASGWLDALETANVYDLSKADYFALTAYQAGDFSGASRWLERAQKDSLVSLWVKAKLLMRDGSLNQAAATFSELVRQFPDAGEYPVVKDFFWNPSWYPDYIPILQRIGGERATLQMARGDYIDALNLLLRNDYWLDAAYVAERVLTIGELKKYVDANWPPAALPHSAAARAWEPLNEAGLSIRWLLGRCLLRENRFTEARDYFPTDLLPVFDTYVENLRTGRDKTKPASERANALATAARTIRSNGMKLAGSECDPDWGFYEGDYDTDWTFSARMHNVEAKPFVTDDERKRMQRPVAKPDKRFHYRYVASDLAWEAAALMPDNTDETARFLCEAGGWLKYRDPQAANRFYVALVKRCRKTDLGRQADAKRWFP